MWLANQKDEGFTLLEILVALMVLAISYTALSQTVSTSLSQARAGADLIKAVELAERLSVEVTVEDKLVYKGLDEPSGLAWEIESQSVAKLSSADRSDYSFATIRIRKPGMTADLFALHSIVKTSDQLQ